MKQTLAGVSGVLVLAPGCAGTHPQKITTTAVSFRTVEQEHSRAPDKLESGVTLLRNLVESPDAAFGEAYGEFVSALARLNATVQALRDQAKAMDLRRDEVLQYWLEQTSGIQSPELRKEAEARRTHLMKSHLDLNACCTPQKRSYAPLHASLHDCASFLAADPQEAEAKALDPELKKIREGEERRGRRSQEVPRRAESHPRQTVDYRLLTAARKIGAEEVVRRRSF